MLYDDHWWLVVPDLVAVLVDAVDVGSRLSSCAVSWMCVKHFSIYSPLPACLSSWYYAQRLPLLRPSLITIPYALHTYLSHLSGNSIIYRNPPLHITIVHPRYCHYPHHLVCSRGGLQPKPRGCGNCDLQRTQIVITARAMVRGAQEGKFEIWPASPASNASLHLQASKTAVSPFHSSKWNFPATSAVHEDRFFVTLLWGCEGSHTQGPASSSQISGLASKASVGSIWYICSGQGSKRPPLGWFNDQAYLLCGDLAGSKNTALPTRLVGYKVTSKQKAPHTASWETSWHIPSCPWWTSKSLEVNRCKPQW